MGFMEERMSPGRRHSLEKYWAKEKKFPRKILNQGEDGSKDGLALRKR
jgi:hypothetical protein